MFHSSTDLMKKGFSLHQAGNNNIMNLDTITCTHCVPICIYYMDKGILLATKTLVEFIRHYIRDPSGVFSVCHAREWYIDKFPPFFVVFFKMADFKMAKFITFANNKKMLICL